MADPVHWNVLDQHITNFVNVLQLESKDFKDLYTLGHKLGQGHFGITYLCTEKDTNLKYACKCISKRKLVSKEAFDDVCREVKIMYHLTSHPNIVAIKRAYEDATMVYLVMELCEGGELFGRMIERRTYTEAKAASLIRTIVDAVKACHNFGVVHCDLKPENSLFVSKHEDSILKVVDFGSSLFYEPGEVLIKIVDSPYYVAPEVLNQHYGPKADIWSVGMILYILLSGALPFWAETMEGIFEKIMKREPLNFEAHPWPGISEGAKDLLHKMLNPDPCNRYTASEVLKHQWICEGDMVP